MKAVKADGVNHGIHIQLHGRAEVLDEQPEPI